MTAIARGAGIPYTRAHSLYRSAPRPWLSFAGLGIGAWTATDDVRCTSYCFELCDGRCIVADPPWPYASAEDSMTDRWLGWHFLSADRRLRWGSRALDALIYAPGPVVCRVELLGERLDGGDKSCARERRVLWIADATAGLHAFACAVAMDALHLTEARGARVDPRSWVAIETKRRWLRGEATDAELHAAWSAARSAALSAALSAESAAWSAALSAAWSAAWSAAQSAQNVVLETLLGGLAP